MFVVLSLWVLRVGCGILSYKILIIAFLFTLLYLTLRYLLCVSFMNVLLICVYASFPFGDTGEV